MEDQFTAADKSTCTKCESIFFDDSVFCKTCGSKRIEAILKEKTHDNNYKSNLKQLSVYSFLILILLSIAGISDYSFAMDIFWTVFFAFIDVGFAYSNGATFSLVFPNKVLLKPLLSIIGIAIISGIFIHFAVGELNIILFGEDVTLLYSSDETAYPLLLSIISVAVFPAIFEELAFRGFLFNNISYLSGKKGAVIGSAFLFTLAHFSILSFFWLFPFGLLLGYFRSRYNTLIYGMIGHFTHNATALLIEYSLLE
ncbi:MAG: type II CAAX endopeptidase family protein [Vicingaceae bacterium]